MKIILFFRKCLYQYFHDNCCGMYFGNFEDSIIFETRNTKYYLKYDTVPNETEVMCA